MFLKSFSTCVKWWMNIGGMFRRVFHASDCNLVLRTWSRRDTHRLIRAWTEMFGRLLQYGMESSMWPKSDQWEHKRTRDIRKVIVEIGTWQHRCKQGYLDGINLADSICQGQANALAGTWDLYGIMQEHPHHTSLHTKTIQVRIYWKDGS